MQKLLKTLLALTASALVVQADAGAAVIGFDAALPSGLPLHNALPYTESGYAFASSLGDAMYHNDVFTLVPGSQTTMGDGKTMSISFQSPVKGGVKVIKTYTFTRGSYVIGVDTKVQNVGTAPVTPRTAT